MIGIRYPMDAHLVGDSRETLRALIPMLQRKKRSLAGREDREGRPGMARPVRPLGGQSTSAGRSTPQAVAAELSPRLPDGAILTADSGSGTNWWARHLSCARACGPPCPARRRRWDRGRRTPSRRGSRPDRPVIASIRGRRVPDDGMNEMITVKRYLDRLTGRTRSSSACSTTRTSTRSPGSSAPWPATPKYPGSGDIPDVPYAAYAELLGLKGIVCADPKKVGAAPRTRRSPPTGP
ncbi:hypothetical protein LV779_07185 [Streptomyces thinghirensis]|nr:hypothetical protein [Streptomyces thinghirensis]